MREKGNKLLRFIIKVCGLSSSGNVLGFTNLCSHAERQEIRER